MASTVLSDVIEPDVWAAYVQELSLEKSLLVRSGIVERNLALDSFLAGGGRTIDMPKWQDLADIDPNISDDNGTASINNIQTRQERAIRHNRNQVWGSMDLVSQLAGSDAMDAIANRVADYWVRHDQRLMLAIIEGLLLDDTTDAGADPDLLVDIAAADNVDIVTANQFNPDALLDTFQLLGDAKGFITAIALHSVIHTEMQKQNLIDFTPDSEANVGFGTYMGKTLLIDDGLTVDETRTASDGTTVQPMYDTVCFGPGAFQWGNGSPRVPAEVDRNPLEGSGGGEEFIVSRREFVLHPVGFIYSEPAIGGPSPTDAELRLDNAYARVDADGSRQRAMRFCVLRSN